MEDWTEKYRPKRLDEIVGNEHAIAIPVLRRTSLNPWIAKEIDYPLTPAQKTEFLIAKIKAKLVPIFEPNIWVWLPYQQYTVSLHEIMYLTKGRNRSLRILTDNEFPWFTNPVIQTYAYATGMDLDGLYKSYTQLIDTLCSTLTVY